MFNRSRDNGRQMSTSRGKYAYIHVYIHVLHHVVWGNHVTFCQFKMLKQCLVPRGLDLPNMSEECLIDLEIMAYKWVPAMPNKPTSTNCITYPWGNHVSFCQFQMLRLCLVPSGLDFQNMSEECLIDLEIMADKWVPVGPNKPTSTYCITYRGVPTWLSVSFKHWGCAWYNGD